MLTTFSDIYDSAKSVFGVSHRHGHSKDTYKDATNARMSISDHDRYETSFQKDSAPICFDTTSPARDTPVNRGSLHTNLGGKGDVTLQRLAAHSRELMRIRFIVVHTMNLRYQESVAISLPWTIQSCWNEGQLVPGV